MKKILITSILSFSMLSNYSFAEIRDPSRTSGGSSAVIVISPLIASYGAGYLLRDLSTNNKPIKINEIREKGNGKTSIYGEANGRKIEFETDTQAVKKSNIKLNDNIEVKDAKFGYVMGANNVVLGVIPNSDNPKAFKQEKLK